jgi:hypothetical protein
VWSCSWSLGNRPCLEACRVYDTCILRKALRLFYIPHKFPGHAEGACQEVLIATDVAEISWAAGIWTLDETRSCYGKPVYYKAVALDGNPVYASYNSQDKYFLQDLFHR